jgi:signal transduction histidine kinase
MIGSILALAWDNTRHEPRLLVGLSAVIGGICQDTADTGEPVTFSGTRDVTISGRATALQRAVSNLGNNAVKYGRSAAVILIPQAERVVIVVED